MSHVPSEYQSCSFCGKSVEKKDSSDGNYKPYCKGFGVWGWHLPALQFQQRGPCPRWQYGTAGQRQ